MSDTSARVSDWSDSLYRVYKETPNGVERVADEIDAAKSFFSNRTIAVDENVNGVNVITSFCCLRWGHSEPPLVYETWAFGMNQDKRWRFATREKATENHHRVVEALALGTRLTDIK